MKGWKSVGLVVVLVAGTAASYAADSAQEHGAAEFREKGCPQCHMVAGVGGHKGPDLSGVGRRLKKDALRKQIIEGGGAMPAFGEALSGDEVELLVRYLQHCRAKTPRGEVTETVTK